MRLEAGDWVVAIGAAGVLSPGLGKLTGGDYQETTLIRARVELPSGVRWFHPGELRRISPELEAALLEEALERGLVPAERDEGLRAALARFRLGSEFVRTPRLLDALWAVLRDTDAPGLAELFELSALELWGKVPAEGYVPLTVEPPEWLEADDGTWDDDDEDDDDRYANRNLLIPEDPEDPEGDDAWDEDEDWDEEDDWGEAPEDPLAEAVALADHAEAFAYVLREGRGWTEPLLLERGSAAVFGPGGWIPGLVGRVLEAFPSRPAEEPLAEFLLEDDTFQDEHGAVRPHLRLAAQPVMQPSPRFPVPPLSTHAEVARWLGLDLDDLDWFCDPRGWLRREPPGPLQHYRYAWLRKRSGGRRLVEAPKQRTKAIQRALLREVLAHVPPHDAAHGFRPGRSVLTYARPHVGQALVLRMDLRHFFPSIGAGRVAATFHALGYPPGVAQALTHLVTTATPDELLDPARLDPEAVDRLRRRHLPQGAPTSPALANLCAYGLDVRLSAAAAKVGATYTRYADDLAFSGDEAFRRRASRFRRLVVQIATDEGFDVHWAKNRWMRPHAQQRLAGLVLNERPRPARAEFDRLKATLHNCVRHGPEGQDRAGRADLRAHLQGRVAWFCHTDPARGAKLRALFERIDWPESPV